VKQSSASHRVASSPWLGIAAVVLGLGVAPISCATGAAASSGSTADGDAGDAGDEVAAEAMADMRDSSVALPDTSVPPPQDSGSALDAPQAADVVPDVCAGGKIWCGAGCVDPTSDPDNCGMCGNTCPTGICGSTLAADMTMQPAKWSFNGAAVYDPTSTSARMTTAMTESVAGSVVYANAIVTDEFTATFSFRIGAGGGGQFDGMGFMLETNGPTALGSNGGGLGMEGLTGFGAEFDIYDNSGCGDSNANHVGIDQLTNCNSGLPTSLWASNDLSPIDLDDGNWHTASVELSSGGMMSVGVDGTMDGSTTLTGFMPGNGYFYGFAGAIGGGSGSLGAQTEVKDVSIRFPTPRCL
jgi:hypothetical protein